MITSWKCDACGITRPDAAISVHKVDLGECIGFPKGTMQRNIKYCNDNDTCLTGAVALGEKEKENYGKDRNRR